MTTESDLATAASASDPRVGLRAVRALRRLLEELERTQVRRARRQGWSWAGDRRGAGRQPAGRAQEARQGLRRGNVREVHQAAHGRWSSGAIGDRHRVACEPGPSGAPVRRAGPGRRMPRHAGADRAGRICAAASRRAGSAPRALCRRAGRRRCGSPRNHRDRPRGSACAGSTTATSSRDTASALGSRARRRRCSSWRSGRRSRWGTTTSAPSTSCSGLVRQGDVIVRDTLKDAGVDDTTLRSAVAEAVRRAS